MRTTPYTIDLFRGKQKPCRDFFDFALYISFFPQLVAGPIVRSTDFLPQLEKNRRITWTGLYLGFRQFTIGLFKKVFIADNLAVHSDIVFGNTGIFDGPSTWAAVAAYSVQIYCDFSGYSDMAIGVARMLGFELHQNFRFPYLAKSPSDFWRRWHISLSEWLRDYLYIPLGGSRGGRARTVLNLMVTMLLGGLWHGAAWTFVLWGGLHGGGLIAGHAAQPVASRMEKLRKLRTLLGWALTMVLVSMGWVLFRCQTFTGAVLTYRQLFMPSSGVHWIPPLSIALLILVVIVHLVQVAGFERLFELPPSKLHTPLLLTVMIWIAVLFAPQDFRPFVYFQF